MTRPAAARATRTSARRRFLADAWALGDLLRDFFGLLDFLDLLNLAGKGLMRVNMKALTLALLFYLGVNRLWIAVAGHPAIEEKTVTSVTVTLACIAVFGGILLVLATVVVRGTRLSLAQACHLNLTEVRKRSEYRLLALELWRHVFQMEARVRQSLQLRRKREREVRALLEHLEDEPFGGTVSVPGVPAGGDEMDLREARVLRRLRERGLHFTRLGFLFAAERLLRHPVPPHLHRRVVGFDFARVVDYFDGGYFDVTDDRLAFQFSASPVLMEARREVALPRAVRLRFVVGGVIRRMWFLLVSRAFAIQVARRVEALERALVPLPGADRPRRGYFSALHLVWPSPDCEREIAELFGAAGLERVRAERRGLIAAVFGRNPDSSFRVVDRMFAPNFLFAYEIRKRYDPDYVRWLVEGEARDLAFLRMPARRLDAERRDLAARARRLERLAAACDRAAREAGADAMLADPEARRAVEVSFLAGRASLVQGVADVERGVAGARERFAASCAAAAAARGETTRTLRELRIHHLLCREQIVNYRRQLAEMIGADQREADRWPTSSIGSSGSSTT